MPSADPLVIAVAYLALMALLFLLIALRLAIASEGVLRPQRTRAQPAPPVDREPSRPRPRQKRSRANEYHFEPGPPRWSD